MNTHKKSDKGIAVGSNTGQAKSALSAYSSEYQGPMPDPQSLKLYQEIDPNFAKEFLEIAKKEQNISITLALAESSRKDRITDANIRQADNAIRTRTIGQWMAPLLFVLSLAASVYVALVTKNQYLTYAIGLVCN